MFRLGDKIGIQTIFKSSRLDEITKGTQKRQTGLWIAPALSSLGNQKRKMSKKPSELKGNPGDKKKTQENN